ncbi:putative N-acetyltransferase ycf52-like [Panicum miliaceum]|uniref:N-acetyltransferase ycf52-like n=1 Tax=Panicum miliaceum TaxID=4540 RepID=A0A3L6SQ32_PANMI|nr:putative N-acetyltransferase ycf52-like [Panicum miliaceum]
MAAQIMQPRPRPRPRSRSRGITCPTTSNHRGLLRLPRASAATNSSVRLTVSDAELASRGFAVRRTAEGIDVAALNEVFARVGFPRRQEERLRRALAHSRVWLSEAGRPVAFARAAGDGLFNRNERTSSAWCSGAARVKGYGEGNMVFLRELTRRGVDGCYKRHESKRIFDLGSRSKVQLKGG